MTTLGKGEVHVNAQFSPNGRWIAYTALDESSGEVRLVRPDGSKDHRLPVGCQDPCLEVGTPTWITNHRLAVVKVKGPVVDDTASEALLWTVKRDGSSLHRMSPAGDAGKYEDAYAT